MKIIVDDRERDVYQHLQQIEKPDSIMIEKQTLPLGDFLVVRDDETQTPVLLFERKSFSDLFSSIKDGRYEEQSFRLLNDERFPYKKDIVYLIEGVYSQLRQKSDKKILFSALTSLSYFKGFSVLRTNSTQDTAELILHMVGKIERDLKKGKTRHNWTIHETQDSSSGSQSSAQPQQDYSSVVKTVKKENITKCNIAVIMLSQIPGISHTTATVIMNHANNSLTRLIQILETNPDELKELKIGEKQRKINKSCVVSLKNFLCDVSSLESETKPEPEPEPEPEPQS